MVRYCVSSFWGILTFVLLAGCSPTLHVDAYRGNLLSVRKILDHGENVSKTDYRGWTALHYAAEGNQREIVDLLLMKGAEINALGDRGETPLHVATYYCHEEVVKTLLEKGANFAIKFKSEDGFWGTLPIIASANCCGPNLLKDLLNAGADGNEIETEYGYSPLIYAAANGKLQTVKVLLLADVDVSHGDAYLPSGVTEAA